MTLPDFDLARKRFSELRQKYNPFFEHVKAGHQAHADVNRGHGLEHDAQVALNCLAFAPDEWTGEKTWIAAFCHSMDYWKRGDDAAYRKFVSDALKQIPDYYLDQAEHNEITRAVLRHHLKNQSDDSIVQQVLQDADRIGILQVSTAFRIGRGYPDLQLVGPEDFPALSPDSDYLNPTSCLNDFENCRSEFPPQFRTEGAKALAEQVLLPVLDAFFAAVREQHGKYGIIGLAL